MPIDGTLSFTTPPPALPSSLSPSLPPPLPPGQPFGKHSSHLMQVGADVNCMQNNFSGYGLSIFKDFAPFQICPFPFHNALYLNKYSIIIFTLIYLFFYRWANVRCCRRDWRRTWSRDPAPSSQPRPRPQPHPDDLQEVASDDERIFIRRLRGSGRELGRAGALTGPAPSGRRLPVDNDKTATVGGSGGTGD